MLFNNLTFFDTDAKKDLNPMLAVNHVIGSITKE